MTNNSSDLKSKNFLLFDKSGSNQKFVSISEIETFIESMLNLFKKGKLNDKSK